MQTSEKLCICVFFRERRRPGTHRIENADYTMPEVWTCDTQVLCFQLPIHLVERTYWELKRRRSIAVRGIPRLWARGTRKKPYQPDIDYPHRGAYTAPCRIFSSRISLTQRSLSHVRCGASFEDSLRSIYEKASSAEEAPEAKCIIGIKAM